MLISDFLPQDRIVPELAAHTKGRLLQLLAQRAALDLKLDAEQLLTALDRREALGSTGIGGGVAIPHTSLPALKRPYALLARLSRPLEFDAIDDRPIDLAILLLTPTDPATHLKALSLISRQLRSDAVLARIRNAPDAGGMWAAMAG